MRKLFWGCFAAGVGVTAGVFTAAGVAVRHPDSFVGRVAFRAAQTAGAINPLAGLTSSLMPQESVELTQVGGAEELAEVVEEVAQAAEPMPIVIPEDEPVPPARMPIMPDTLVPVQYTESIGQGYAPTIMPRVEEESEAAAEPERLHMPKVVDEAEEQESDTCPLGGCADKLLRMFEKMIKHSEPSEPAAQPECREDPHRHHHHQGCPYTGGGHGYHHPMGGLPSLSPIEPVKQVEPKSEGQLMRKKRGLFQEGPKAIWHVGESLDTMEYRPADRPLSDYGHGPL